jgi:hypothetical protein
MPKFSRVIASRVFTAALCTCLAAPSLAQTSVRSIRVLGTKGTVEVEVEASDRIVPDTQVLSDPDRLVVDFPNAVPSNQLRSQSVDRGEVKDLRIGLFQSKPPVTRLVLDLKSAQSYQVFPSGRTVMIKVSGDNASDASVSYGAGRPNLVAANYMTSSEPVQIANPVQPGVQVSYQNGLLGIHANKATLAQVLFAIQQRTGADISIAAGAEQEQVVADIAPAPAPEVLARLLNGSRFNFLILSAADNPLQLDRVILSARMDVVGYVAPPQPAQAQSDPAADDTPVVQNQPAITPPPPGDAENKPAENGNNPN